MKLGDGPERDQEGPGAGWIAFGRLAGLVGSVPFAATVIGLIAVACVAGTVLPQGADVARYLHQNPAAAGKMALFERVGLTRVFSAWWFVGLLCLLASSLCVCTYRRYTAARRARGPARGRAWGSVLTHISLLLILAGGVIRGLYGHRGVLEFREGDTRDYFLMDGQRANLPFSVHLAKFEVEMYDAGRGGSRDSEDRLLVVWPDKGESTALPIKLDGEQWAVPRGEAPGGPGALRVSILRAIPDFLFDSATGQASSRSDEPRNPAIQVETVYSGSTNKAWLFALHPDFNMHPGAGRDQSPPPYKLVYQVRARAPATRSVKDYKSTLQVIEGDAVVREKTIEVNAPLSYKGYTFYQSGYNPRDPKWTSLQVVRDPGVPLVYGGFILMIIGLIVVFYVYPGIAGRTPSANTREEPS